MKKVVIGSAAAILAAAITFVCLALGVGVGQVYEDGACGKQDPISQAVLSLFPSKQTAVSGGAVQSWSGQPTDSASFSGKGKATVRVSAAEWSNAAGIYAVGQQRGVSVQGITVAIMVAIQESHLRVLSNTSTSPDSAQLANQGNGGDHDSFGLFQQRPSAGWGSWQQLMDVTYSAEAFFGGQAGPNHGSPKGLLDVNGWESKTLAQAAQAVQHSATPSAYGQWQDAATKIVQSLSGSALTTITTQTDTTCPDGTDGAASGVGGTVSLAGKTSTEAGQAVIDYGKQFLGVPYVWGGTNPATGLDCSGLVQLVYKHFGVNLPRTAVQQGHTGVTVPAAQAQVGDIVAWNDGSHVALLVGPGMILEEPLPHFSAHIVPLWSSAVHFQHVLP